MIPVLVADYPAVHGANSHFQMTKTVSPNNKVELQSTCYQGVDNYGHILLFQEQLNVHYSYMENTMSISLYDWIQHHPMLQTCFQSRQIRGHYYLCVHETDVTIVSMKCSERCAISHLNL